MACRVFYLQGKIANLSAVYEKRANKMTGMQWPVRGWAILPKGSGAESSVCQV